MIDYRAVRYTSDFNLQNKVYMFTSSFENSFGDAILANTFVTELMAVLGIILLTHSKAYQFYCDMSI